MLGSTKSEKTFSADEGFQNVVIEVMSVVVREDSILRKIKRRWNKE